jgi:hypothetical protein
MSPPNTCSFAGYRFPPDVILLAVRWYLRYGLSYSDVEELLAERIAMGDEDADAGGLIAMLEIFDRCGIDPDAFDE